MPKVSVLIPVYGVEKYIRRCAVSLFEQTLEEVEYIFVDDCSEDKSISVLEETIERFPNSYAKVKILHHSENRGSAAARNTALNMATGEYIIVIDSDDFIESTMLEDLYNSAIDDMADIVVSDYWVNFKDRTVYKKQKAPTTGYECLKALLRGELHASTSNKLVARKLFIDNNIFHYEGLNFSEDMSVLFRLFYYARKVSYLPHAYLHYVQYNTFSYTTTISENSRKNIIRLVDIVETFFQVNKIQDNDLWRDIDYYKLSVKSILLVSCSKEERGQYCNIYNDSVQYLCQHPTLPFHYKCIVLLASKNKISLLNQLLGIFALMKRLLK